MSTYHLNVKIVSRSTGRSSVGAAAYRAGDKIQNERDGITHDYTRKRGVVYSEICLPPNAPSIYADRAELWNAIEKSEKSKNAQTAREIEVALPRELGRSEQVSMLREYVHENFVSRGMIADFAIHNRDKGNNNPHAHIMLTMRSLDEAGQWQSKAKKVYVLDEKGNKIYDKKTRQYKCYKENTNDWDNKENVEQWRESWAQIYNREMEKKLIPDRVDHRSYKRQGIDREPTKHKGPAVHQLEQRGIKTERGDVNRSIEARNRSYGKTVMEIREDVIALQAERATLFPYAREDFAAYGIDIPQGPQEETKLTYTEPREAAPGADEIEARQNALRDLLRAKQAEVAADGQRVTPPQREDAPAKEGNRAHQGRELSSRLVEHADRKRSHARADFVQEIKKAPVRDRDAYIPSPEYSDTRNKQNAVMKNFLDEYKAKAEAIKQEQRAVRERILSERDKGPTDARQGRDIKGSALHEKAQVRGDMGAARGVALPLYTRAVVEMGRGRSIDNIYAMARALETIRREDIRSYADYDSRIGELRQQRDKNNEHRQWLKEQIKREAEPIMTLETYEEYLPYRQEIEKAGIFQRGKLEKRYRLEMQSLEGCEEDLQRWRIDPETVTAESLKERVKGLEQGLISVERESKGYSQKSTALQESRDMMKQLFEDHGIDHDARHQMRSWDRDRERGIDR